MQKNSNDIVVFLIVVSILIIGMVLFIIMMLYLYSKRQDQFKKGVEQLKLDHEKTIMATQLEIQEQTFQNISREIHDNISLSLTLAKLYLRTIDWNKKDKKEEQINTSISLIGKSITDLNNISKGLNADIIIQDGLLKAIEEELQRIRQADLFSIDFEITGQPRYMDNQKELIIFRIIQEAFNNIIKHANAKATRLTLYYDLKKMDISISDNGNGFDTNNTDTGRKAGLKNMATRIKVLNGKMNINSQVGLGSVLSFTIPYE